MKKVQVVLEFSSEQEYEDWIAEQSVNRTARLVLGELRNEMRTTVRYGEPTDRDEYWYDRLFKLAVEKSEGVDAWEF